MSNFIKVLAILACTWCVSGTANAQARLSSQPPSCPGKLILDGRDEANNVTYVHCECPDGSWAPGDQDGEFYCPPPQAQMNYQQPVQNDPSQDIINNMLGNAASQFGSQIGDALGRRITRHW